MLGSNKISQDPVVNTFNVEEDDEEDQFEDEDTRCMQLVQSVFDEATATEVIKSYLKLLRDTELPEESCIIFKHCEFESESGLYLVQSFINCYMLSRNKRLMCK